MEFLELGYSEADQTKSVSRETDMVEAVGLESYFNAAITLTMKRNGCNCFYLLTHRSAEAVVAGEFGMKGGGRKFRLAQKMVVVPED